MEIINTNSLDASSVHFTKFHMMYFWYSLASGKINNFNNTYTSLKFLKDLEAHFNNWACYWYACNSLLLKSLYDRAVLSATPFGIKYIWSVNFAISTFLLSYLISFQVKQLMLSVSLINTYFTLRTLSMKSV